MLNKLYGAGIILAILTAAWFRYDYVVGELSASKEKLAKAGDVVTQMNQKIQAQITYQKAEFERNQILLAGKTKDEKDLADLRACLADGTCVPRVRIKTSCPAVPPAVPSATAGADAATTGFAEVDAGAYYNLAEAHKKVIWMISGLQAELNARQ